MTGIFIKEKRGKFLHTYTHTHTHTRAHTHTHRHTHRSRPCETRGRDWSDATIRQRTPRLPGKDQKLAEVKEGFPSRAFTGSKAL